MAIQSDHLQAFLYVHATGSFTLAAEKAGLTQSALSQKIKRLESRLEAALFVRAQNGLSLTPAGERLLVYARQQQAFEDEFLSEFEQGHTELGGLFRVAGFSSVLRSVIVPSLAPLMRKHPRVQITFSQHEMGELPGLLKTNAADLIFLDYQPALSGVESEIIGQERYVVIESTAHKGAPADLYLDHGPDDNATESYFRAQGGKVKSFRRGFMGDVYGILDGVAQGLGRAVMSQHLVEGDRRFKIQSGHKAYERPLAMCWNQQAWYPRLHQKVRETLSESAERFL